MDAMEQHLKRIVGGKIRRLVEYGGLHQLTGGEFWGFTVEGKDGKVYQTLILSDPEGNGPGFLEIMEDGE